MNTEQTRGVEVPLPSIPSLKVSLAVGKGTISRTIRNSRIIRIIKSCIPSQRDVTEVLVGTIPTDREVRAYKTK
jgi:hypothetical protein